MLAASLDDLNSHIDWFADPSRRAEDNAGPFVVVVDNFYPDPDVIRATALQQKFVRYAPPSADQAGEDIAAQFKGQKGTWSCTALFVVRGRPVRQPFEGYAYRPPALRERLSEILGEKILPQHWATLGDGWNGVFHLIDGEWTVGHGSVHHHYKAGDIEPRGWSGVVYLSPSSPPESGTSIWRETRSRLCVAPYGIKFAADTGNFDQAYLVENRFNRLVLFRENVLHRAEHGFGRGKDARLSQTLFFRSER